jgi:phosphoribosyl 1,2-cyclic phosphodiesterase
VLEIVSLGSGSSGNALLVRTSNVALLVDCGIEPRRLSAGLTANGLALDQLDAVLISHEHSDHARSLSRIAPANTVLLGTRGTVRACGSRGSDWIETSPERSVSIGDVEVIAIPVSHDAAEPCGFHLRTADGELTVLTDLGSPSVAAAEAVANSDLVVIEANHDEQLLVHGPYAARLKRRILSDSGHLSNEACARLLAEALRVASREPTIWLAHLSVTNNRPLLAKETVEKHLAREGLELDVLALPRRRLGPVWRPGLARNKPRQLSLGLVISGTGAKASGCATVY